MLLCLCCPTTLLKGCEDVVSLVSAIRSVRGVVLRGTKSSRLFQDRNHPIILSYEKINYTSMLLSQPYNHIKKVG